MCRKSAGRLKTDETKELMDSSIFESRQTMDRSVSSPSQAFANNSICISFYPLLCVKVIVFNFQKEFVAPWQPNAPNNFRRSDFDLLVARHLSNNHTVDLRLCLISQNHAIDLPAHLPGKSTLSL